MSTTTQTAMASLVGSLADNKAALGRRYAEWAVSRADARVRGGRGRDGPGRARPLALDLPGAEGARRRDPEQEATSAATAGWRCSTTSCPTGTRFIAANLLVDGVLTTFVAACVGSSVEPMATRAKKILQEEGSHRVHGEAWAKRLCRGDQRDAFVARLEETWAQASRWIGPDDDPAYAAALEAGEVKQTAAHQRALMRDWLTALLAGEGVSISLPEPGLRRLGPGAPPAS